MPAPAEILDLIDRFGRNEDDYRSGYGETEVRVEFVDPFFKCLGWDIHNAQGFAEAFKDVIHEDEIKVSGATKAPDYSFRIGGTRKFFLEAKRPSVHLKTDPDPAFQLRRYGWSAKLPLSLLTNFGELAVYDCRVKPDQNDKASAARINYLTYREYADKWDDLAGTFSKDAIQKGYFDKFAETKKGKRGTATVDAAFLEEIESWREELARNFATRNKDLDQRQLNYAVQVTIDRILFLRMCEDRGIEPYGQLGKLRDDPLVYKRLFTLFQRADDRYNSGLFHFEKDPDRPEAMPDTLTPKLKLDDKPLKDILKNLYYPDSPYEFSVLPAEILGHVYEQFLGKVIRLTAGHQAKIEDKPEVKKAGGVYYTPTYIVDYIVKHTVGKLLGPLPSGGQANGPALLLPSPGTPGEGSGVRVLSPRDASKLRILDPACGSGSFLLGAYQYLLNWHRDWYFADGPAKHTKEIYQGAGGVWRLTSAEKKRILLNNIYGVDIDVQAVEVTKLSLLLKVLEDENEQTLSSQMRLFHERALPDLGNNIKCGNSLIGPDFYEGQQEMFDEEEKYRINVFDWNAEFSKIMKAGGFDAVIGNPPYGAYFSDAETRYFRQCYECPANSLDSFLLFVERSAKHLTKTGLLGMIIPSGWVSTPSAKPLRQLFLNLFVPRSFVSLPFDVFSGAYIDTVILIAEKVASSKNSQSDEVRLIVFPHRFKIASVKDFDQFEKNGRYGPWLKNKNLEFLITCSAEEAQLIAKIQSQPRTLDDYLLVKRGIEIFNPVDSQKDLIKPQAAFTGVLQRYHLEHGAAAFVSYDAEIQESKPIQFFSGERILLRQVLSRKLRLQAVLASETFLTNQSVQSLIQRNTVAEVSLPYLLGLLNSRLLSWLFRNVNSVARRDDFPKIIIQQTREMPVRPINFSVPADQSRHARIVSLVEQMFTLHRQSAAAKTPDEQARLQREIDATDGRIDRLVYEFYGLTEEEIRIVEGRATTK